MNIGIVIYTVGWAIFLESAFMILPGLVGVIYGEKQGYAYFICALAGLLIGAVTVLIKPKNKQFFAREEKHIRMHAI